MSAQIVGSCREWSLSLRRKFRGVAQPALVLGLGGLLTFSAGCDRVESCEYRCTQEQNACPVGLTCDITLGYCVSEGYAGTCDAATREVTVCKDEPVELELPDEAPSDPNDIEGLLNAAAIEDGKLKTTFGKKTVLAFGDPNQTRQYWQVDVSDDCPVVDATLPSLCVGDVLSRPLAASGGEGSLRFELLGEDSNFTLSADGILAGKATIAGDHQLEVAVTDERGLNTVRSVKVAVSGECPDVQGPLPDSCAGTRYEVELGIVGKAPVRVTDFTPVQKDGKDLTSPQAEKLVSDLDLRVVENGDGYVLTAAPRLEALGSYLLALKLENALRIEQRNVAFDVRECSAVQADFSACQGQTLDFDLEGSPGDVWTFYDDEDPLDGPLAFVSDRRLRGELTTPGLYEVRARVQNAAEETDSLVTVTLALLSSSEPACTPSEDAGADAGSSEPSTSHGETFSTAPFDAATPPVEEGELAQGCVGRPYEFVVPLDGVTSNTWHADGLPAGLTIDADGVISGTPNATFNGSIDVTGATGSGSVGNSFRLTVHAWCSVVFKGVPDGLTQTHLYQADRRPDVSTRDLSDDLTGDEEVTDFALSPDQQHVAFSVFDPYSNTTRVVVKRRVPLGVGQTEALVGGNITASPFSEWVSDLSWGTDRHISLIVGPVTETPDAGADAGLSPASVSQTLYVFDLVKNPPATTATQVLAKATRDARDLVWLDAVPCVTLADFPGIPGSRESVCWKLIDGTSSSGAEVFNKFDTYQVRGHEGRFLQAHPLETGTIVLTSWMPNAPSAELLQVIHQATFASPLGDLVGTVRDTAMEIARTGDDTSRDPSVDYTPLGLIDDCTTIDAWRAGGPLACSTGLTDPNEKVTIATPTGSGLSTLPPFDAPGHATSARRMFLENSYYVYDNLDGALNYVDLTATPLQVQAQNHGQGRRAVALEPLDDSRFVMQGTSALWVGVVTSGALGLTQVNGAGTPAAFSECEPAFGWMGFETWCGGDEISRRFQVAPDDDLGVFQTDSSNLELFSVSSTSQLKRVDDIRVSCGEHPHCLTEFQLAR